MPPAGSPALKDRATVILPLRGKGGGVADLSHAGIRVILQIGVRYADQGGIAARRRRSGKPPERHSLSARRAAEPPECSVKNQAGEWVATPISGSPVL